MPRLPVVFGICLLAVALGAVTVWLARGPGARGVRGAPAAVGPSGRAPAFHVFGAAEERQAAVRAGLARLTAGKATELGALKDDLALLADDPEVIRAILSQYQLRAHLTKFEAAGFADLFALIRHPEFVGPTSRLLDHEEWIVRRNAITATLTQADPSLTPKLDREYLRLVAEHPAEGEQTRLEILQAGRLCGGDHLPVLLDHGLGDSMASVRALAVELVADAGFKAMLPRVQALMADGEARVRLRAAWSAVALGDRTVIPSLLAFLDPREPGEALMAVDAVTALKLREAVPVLRERLSAAGVDVEPTFTVALVVLGDGETVGRLQAELDRRPAEARRENVALMGVAASGNPAFRPYLEKAVDAGGQARILAVVRGLASADGPPDPGLVQRILSRDEITHPAMVEAVVTRSGDALVPFLTERLRQVRDDHRAALCVASLGMIGTELARQALIAAHDLWPGLVEQQLRLLDLARRRKGTQ